MQTDTHVQIIIINYCFYYDNKLLIILLVIISFKVVVKGQNEIHAVIVNYKRVIARVKARCLVGQSHTDLLFPGSPCKGERD